MMGDSAGMETSMLRVLGVVLVLTFTTGIRANLAQESAQGIPADVVAMLSPMVGASSANGGGELRAGGPPADFPTGLFPRGATVAATLLAPARNTTVVVAAAPALSADQLEQHETALVGNGWVSFGPRFRGFATSVTGSQPPISICRGSDFVSLISRPRSAGGVYLQATLTRDPRRTCTQSMSSTLMADIDVPRLPPPPNTKLMGGGGGGGSIDSLTSVIRLETTMAPRAVTEHYEKLLVAAGWKVTGRLRDGDTMAIVRFDVPSRIGPALSGTLSVSKLADTQDQDVFLRVVRTTRDPRTGSFVTGTTGLVRTGP
jgi:hypothetical protein